MKALIVEVDKLSPTKANVAALPSVLAVTRSALLKRRESGGEKQLKTLGVFAAAVTALFVLGLGAGRVINLIRSGELSMASFQFSTQQAQAAATPTSAPGAHEGAVLVRQTRTSVPVHPGHMALNAPRSERHT